MSKLKSIDLFAGLGGFHKALHELGHECVFESELDPTLIGNRAGEVLLPGFYTRLTGSNSIQHLCLSSAPSPIYQNHLKPNWNRFK